MRMMNNDSQEDDMIKNDSEMMMREWLWHLTAEWCYADWASDQWVGQGIGGVFVGDS